jgi:dTDP-4-dehydrorhamnose reductase
MRGTLIIGASGLIGEHIATTLKACGKNPACTYHNTAIPDAIRINIARDEEVGELFESILPKIVFLPASLTNVDYCEDHPDESYQTNVIGVQHVVRASNKAGSRIIYFSSDYLFNGEKGPYSETDVVNPISEYGRQKLEAEHYISLFAKDYLIIRTTVVYGWERQGKNFVLRLVNSLREGIPVKAPVDQIGSPTYVNNLAQIVVELSESNLQGVINVAGPDCISRYNFAYATAQAFHLDANLILPVQTEELRQPAKRPLNAGLKIEKVAGLSKTPVIAYRSGLAHMAGTQSDL